MINNEQVPNNGLKSELKGRGLFYGVIAVATFIVMAVGATFAYFTATTNSTNTAVQTGSTTLKLEFISYGTAWMKEDLIPAAYEVASYSFVNQDDTSSKLLNEDKNLYSNSLCVDDYGNSICSVYVFQVKNTAASPQSVSLNVVSELNEFTSLAAMAFEIDVKEEDYINYYCNEEGKNEDQCNVLVEGTDNKPNGNNDPNIKWKGTEPVTEDLIPVVDGYGQAVPIGSFTPIFVNRNGVTKTKLNYTDGVSSAPIESVVLKQVLDSSTNTNENVEDRTAKIANNFEIPGGGAIKTYALVLFIAENDLDQTESDANKDFTGQVVITSGDGKSGVSGYISAVNGPANQEPNGEGDDNSEQDGNITP